jgi:peptidyl-dipeptidase A
MLRFAAGRGSAVLAAAFLIAAPVGARAQSAGGAPTVDEARVFVDAAEVRLLDLSTKAGRAAWVQANFITDDTERIASDLNKDLIAASMELAKAATRFDGVALPAELDRKMKLLKLAPIPLPAPSDPKLQTELAQTAAWLEATYGKGRGELPRHRTDHEDHGRESELPRAARRLEGLAHHLAAHAPALRALRHPRQRGGS